MNDHFYTFREHYIPERMAYGIKLYVEHHVKPGSFLSAVICNDLTEAVGQADDENLRNIPAYVAYFYNEAPRGCWGSPERFTEWLNAKREAD
jgi:hypothetical protein